MWPEHPDRISRPVVERFCRSADHLSHPVHRQVPLSRNRVRRSPEVCRPHHTGTDLLDIHVDGHLATSPPAGSHAHSCLQIGQRGRDAVLHVSTLPPAC